MVTGQDIDTLVTSESRKPFTFLDQIEDKQERSAFLRLYNERRPQQRRRMAAEFLREWPRSWLLSQVLDMACEAAMDLNDDQAALTYGKDSVRLMPENPFLLVRLANLRNKLNLPDGARQSALDALEQLDRFGRPAAVSKKAWPRIQQQARSSALVALAGAMLTEALRSKSKERIVAGMEPLRQAREIDPQDPEIPYLLGIAQLSLGERQAAADDFAAAARITGPFQERAREQLRALPSPAADPRPTAPPTPTQADVPLPPYAGSASCRECHAARYRAWERTGMARMFRAYRPENVLADFTRQPPDVRVSLKNDRHYIYMPRGDGTWGRYSVDYTIGSKWQQAYATRLPDGRIQVFPVQYNVLEKGWVNYWKIIDPPNSDRANPALFHQMSPGANYQVNCAPCHTSQLHARKSGLDTPQDFEFREMGVDCEMCHGPSSRHVAAMAAGKPYSKRPVDPPVDFKRLDHRDDVAICAQCHMQSAMREPTDTGEWNYSSEGDTFFRRYSSRPYIEFSRRAFYKDGRLRETTFIVESLMRTACYRKGELQCTNCHDPHPADAASNPTSLKYRDHPDEMCLPCHRAIGGDIEKHTHHAPASEGSRCVACHMPRIMNSLLFVARSHQVDDIPRADLTQRFGPQESPNACLLCHRDKDAAWAAALLLKW